jgi:hypothetical protein
MMTTTERPVTFFYSYACRNSACRDYKRLTGNALAKRRPLCPRCGWSLVLARIIGMRRHVLSDAKASD